MSSEGWIKLYREVFDSDIWHDVTTFRLFIFLIGKASHKDGFKYKGMILNEGQYVSSYRKLRDALAYKEGRGYKKYSLSTVKACVNKLIKAERVNVKETELGTLFTIVNYAKYQELEDTGKESKNTLNEKVRTNAELTPNDVRTKSEQDQELKNLRIKELYTTTANSEDAIVFYQNNFGMIRPAMSEEIIDWINDFGDKMVIEAMQRSLDRNKPSWGYARSILQSWSNKGIKTMEQVQAEDIEFQSQKMAKHQRYSKPQTQAPGAPVPEWFRQQKQQQKAQKDSQSSNIGDANEQKELEQLLKQYSSG
ncbi:DnaD domain-containing protein [Virgibacillus dokdonensis]|uniref:Replication initiation and membrane attachment n=1 Tax=Virgibacillus dokdonensis TaxID=302167 RepID=A0A2K9IZL7_9BACI|nr:DnaD domain protein [Virgibacillus dokdonensis]AUJ25162.1 Replication initiation and membrane attachment [Virgibacillus dokdonensis]